MITSFNSSNAGISYWLSVVMSFTVLTKFAAKNCTQLFLTSLTCFQPCRKGLERLVQNKTAQFTGVVVRQVYLSVNIASQPS